MPHRSPSASEARPTARRSSRLNKNISVTLAKTTLVPEVEIPIAKRRKTRHSDVTSVSGPRLRSSQCNENLIGSSDIIASISGTPKGLNARERALAKREKDLDRKSAQVDAQLVGVSEREEKAAEILERWEIKQAEDTLTLLEDHFTCSLCLEIMATPYCLHPLKCGHSFDAICILRWFFSKLHTPCGGWHEWVACPICRSQLIVTPERIPRHDITFPFTPNRTADETVKDLISRLERKDSVVKRELGSSAKSHVQVKKEDESRDTGLDDWKIGGKQRREWLKREKQGREEMTYLTNNWSTLQSQDFINMKARLRV